ncbi:hypothetical protein M378DRAFT_166269 [Amanita muscaria Koide BX008]|uniref:Uncharacterized protein n=1 Tax=Amanita muscaria (strain Koide BX008) TaxID=946122 RepID=A0A0C2WK62_AMAMK|nr:hypothetical protein M378DRAFT_166269 [Amanita muscaria Koide BX008]
MSLQQETNLEWPGQDWRVYISLSGPPKPPRTSDSDVVVVNEKPELRFRAAASLAASASPNH